ncbi:sperm-associated antigen 8 [Pelobates fuscus]|uniref:sperm-associated antigen 8 n=1 Tax=Pelobates fuscus TaxID=191477 RepID=UPI002FE46A65
MADEKAASLSPCLLHNWVEERATASLDSSPPGAKLSDGHVFRHGHRGIISTLLEAHIADSTTNKDSYRAPSTHHMRLMGPREEMLQKYLFQKFSQGVLEAINVPSEDLNIKESTTKRDYKVDGFTSRPPASNKSHDYRTEQAVTFWTEKLHRIPGVSDIKMRDTPFKKTSMFSTPITQYLDQPLPHSLQNYPNM